MDSREERLPVWTRELLADLRRKVMTATEPLYRELNQLRPRMEKLKRQNEALTELLDCAARGGHPTAVEIAKMIEAYGLNRNQEEVKVSYKCQVCKQPTPAGTQRKLHVIRRKDGSIQRELAVCDPCHAVLAGGVPVRQAMVEAGTANPSTVETPHEIAPLKFGEVPAPLKINKPKE